MSQGVVDQLLTHVNFVGSDALPRREFTLQFNLPVQVKDKRYRPEQNLGSLQKEFRLNKHAHLDQLVLGIDQLSRLVHYKCSANKRLALLELVGAETAALIRRLYVQYRDESGVPEDNARKSNLDRLMELLRLLVEGYQQVFLSLYQLPEYRYQGKRKKITLVGMRILELLYVEQRISALRYQVFPPQRWKDFNQVFFVLWLCNEVDSSHSLMIGLPSHLRHHELESNKSLKSMPRQLFISVQLFGLADCYTWPSNFIQILDSYLKLLEPKLEIKPDEGVELKSGHLLTFSKSDRPPLYRRMSSAEIGCLVDISPLKRQIGHDYACLNTLDGKEALQQVSAPLSVLGQTQRLAFVDMLQYKLQPRQRRNDRDVIEAYRDFTIVSGFMSCYKKLSKKGKNPVNKNSVLEVSLDEMLSGRSSALADDNRDIKHGEWYVVNNSEGGVLVRARESRYLVAMEVGQLALFSQLTDSDGPPQLGYISRLLRSGKGEISVTLQKISSKAEGVVLQTALMHKSGEAVPAFFIRALKGAGWQLLVPSKYTEQLRNGGLFMRRNDRLFSIEVTQVVQRHKDYSLLDIQSASNK